MSRWRLLTGHVDRLAHGAAGVVQVRATGTRASRSSRSRRASRSGGRRRGRGRTASRSWARTRSRRRRSARVAPGCGRAACTRAGAVACTIWPAHARAGSAPARRRRRRRRRRTARARSGWSRTSTPTSSRMVSALCSMHRSPSVATTSNGFNVRVRNGSRSTCAARRAACRAGAARPVAASTRSVVDAAPLRLARPTGGGRGVVGVGEAHRRARTAPGTRARSRSRS